MNWYQRAAILFLGLKLLASIYSAYPAIGPLMMIVVVNLGGFLILRLATTKVLRLASEWVTPKG